MKKPVYPSLFKPLKINGLKYSMVLLIIGFVPLYLVNARDN